MFDSFAFLIFYSLEAEQRSLANLFTKAKTKLKDLANIFLVTPITHALTFYITRFYLSFQVA